MTTKQIDYCIELARTLNFSRATENAFVSQPTFSYQVKPLILSHIIYISITPSDDLSIAQ